MTQVPVPKIVVRLEVPEGTAGEDMRLFAEEFIAGLRGLIEGRNILTGVESWSWKIDCGVLGRWQGIL